MKQNINRKDKPMTTISDLGRGHETWWGLTSLVGTQHAAKEKTKVQPMNYKNKTNSTNPTKEQMHFDAE